MKLNFITTSVLLGLCAVLVFSCSKDEDFEDFYSLDVNASVPSTRSAMYPEESSACDNPPDFLKYSNCGLWSLAQVCGGADDYRWQGAVLSAAESSIDWNEEENMNNSKKRGLTGEEILSVCNRMKEINNAKRGLEKLSGLNRNLPNTFEPNGEKALKVIEDLKTSSKGNTIHGAMVGIETYDDEGNPVEHWVALEAFTKEGNMQVRDQNTSPRYKSMERSNPNLYPNRYKAYYPVSRVKCILYNKK